MRNGCRLDPVSEPLKNVVAQATMPHMTRTFWIIWVAALWAVSLAYATVSIQYPA